MATTQGSTTSFDPTAGLQQLFDVAELVIMIAPILTLALMLVSHIRAVQQQRSGHSVSVWATRSIAGSRHLFGDTSAGEFRRQAQAERQGYLPARR